MKRKPAPVVAYALQWSGTNAQWIDPTSIERKRSDAWKHATKEGSTDQWKAEVARRRRQGKLKAVKVVVLTLEKYQELKGAPRCERRSDLRTLDLFADSHVDTRSGTTA